MKTFMDKDFLLDTPSARTLFHDYAEDMPIFDYHSHLSAREIYEDKKFENITEAWLKFDHYKWRALRTAGVTEDYITGDRSDFEKFQKWAEIMPYLIGNPLYHWTHLELQRYFDITEPLTGSNAKQVYETCNEKLKQDFFSVRNLLRRCNVFALYTTDDPSDDLKWHRALREDGFEIHVLPTYRPDRAVDIEKDGFAEYLTVLGKSAGCEISSAAQLLEVLKQRMEYFHRAGSRISDHGLSEMLYADATEAQADAVLQKRLRGEALTREELKQYKGWLIYSLAKEYHRLGWVMQLHIGPMRNNSTRMFRQLGADAGFDSIHDGSIAHDLSALLDALDRTDELPKTVLYCLNPCDNEVLASMAGNFQGGGIPGKIQFGSAWWFNDNIDGMRRQMTALSQLGMISRFIGMLTDSRSFLSFPRHEYFRRILCNELGNLVESGQYPNDMETVGKIVRDICFNNIWQYIPVV